MQAVKMSPKNIGLIVTACILALSDYRKIFMLWRAQHSFEQVTIHNVVCTQYIHNTGNKWQVNHMARIIASYMFLTNQNIIPAFTNCTSIGSLNEYTIIII
jgi:hypothetical protein